MSRLDLARAASRPAGPGRALIYGPGGSGRTESALIVAATLADDAPVLLIDTDDGAALDHADRYSFVHLPWDPPHQPDELARVIVEAGADFGAVILDTISAPWRGPGGVRDIAARTSWEEARELHRQLIDATRATTAHVIATCDTDVEFVVDAEGKVARIGTVLHQDHGIESRFQVALSIDMAHALTVVGSPCPQLATGDTWLAGDAMLFGAAYGAWLASGEPAAHPDTVAELRRRIEELPPEKRQPCRHEIRARLVGGGPLERLRASQVAEAQSIIDRFTPEPSSPADGDASHLQAGDAPVAPAGESDGSDPVGGE